MADKCHILLPGLILCSILKGTSGVEDTRVFLSSGENVRLPCNNALSDCTSTTWLYTIHSETVELVAGGKLSNIERRERLSLGSDCSLNIMKTTKEDYGCYSCRQYANGKQAGTDAHVYLHVLHVSPSSSQTEIRAGRSVTVSCQLCYYYGVSCDYLVSIEGYQLMWVNQADVNLMTDSRYQISDFSSSLCKISLTTTLLDEDHNREWRCQLTQRNQRKTTASFTVNYSGTSRVEDTHVFFSSSENVRLPCNNALSDCTSTTWIYDRGSGTVELFAEGKLNNIERLERLSLGSDCSLNIKKVTNEDYGCYSCQQYVNGEREGTDASVCLHVLHVSTSLSQTEIRPGRSVTLSCQLDYYYEDSCDTLVHTEGYQLMWVNQAGVNLMTDPRYQIFFSSSLCNISLTTTLLNEDHNRGWRCQLTQRNQLKTSASFTIKYSDAGDTTSETEVSKTVGSLFRVIVIIVEIAVFAAPTVIILKFICARRAENKGRTLTTQMN